MTHFISFMGGGNVMHYQPKLVIELAGNLSEQLSEGRGQRFESSRVRHNIRKPSRELTTLFLKFKNYPDNHDRICCHNQLI